MPALTRYLAQMQRVLSSRRVQYLVLGIGILAIGLFIRLDGLGTIPTWFDEETTADNLRGPVGVIWEAPNKHLSSPLLCNALIWCVQLIETGVFALRLPSVIASVFTIVVVLALPRVGVPHLVALASATLLSVSLIQVR